MIEVKDLAKSFHDKKRGTVHALDGVSFDVKRGEIFGLLGPNGDEMPTSLDGDSAARAGTRVEAGRERQGVRCVRPAAARAVSISSKSK